jgi:hypothetical protein
MVNGMFAVPRTRSQRGLATLDILLGLTIFALVIVTGVQNFTTFRDRAFVTQASSDVKQLAGGIEAVHVKDDAYPATVAANASSLPGVNLTRGSKIGGYGVTGANFRACILSGPSTSRPKAYAIYDSARGSVIEAGRGSTHASCDGSGIDATPTGPTDPNVPTNVTATVVPGETRATITWQAVTGASDYAVHLDGASTPAWTGPDLTTVLTGLDPGNHSVTVTATVDGTTSEQSAPATFIIVGDNDFLANAHPVDITGPDQTWTSVDYNAATANSAPETGEPAVSGRHGRWWVLRAPFAGTYVVRAVPTTSGTLMEYPQIDAWKTTTTTPSSLSTTPDGSTTRNTNNQVLPVSAAAGETVKIRVTGSLYRDPASYRLQVASSPRNDNLASADPITSLDPDTPWTSADKNNSYAGMEAGEPALSGRHGLWWTFTAPRSSTYTLRVVAPTSGTLMEYPQIDVWKTADTAPGALAAAADFATARNTNNQVLQVPGIQGDTYKVRVTGSPYRDPGALRLEVTAGPLNDNLASAESVTDLSPNAVWTSAATDNRYAGMENAEPALSGRNTMWWTFTAPRAGTYQVRVVGPTDATTPFSYPQLDAWKTNVPSAVGLSATPDAATTRNTNNQVLSLTAAAGDTFKVRLSSSLYRDPGAFRIRVNSPS